MLTGVPSMHPASNRRSKTRQRLFAVWYACIAIGFVLLGIRAWVLGAPPWTVILRVLIAAGFALLAWQERRRRPGR